jgi:hypothetical protein
MGLAAGWYLNGCKCGEKEEVRKNYEGDIKLLDEFGFDGVKIDGCGAQRNQTLYAELMAATGKSYTIENCHWGRCTDSDDSSCPTATWCPFNWYRSSGDINSGAQSWLNNLQTTIRFQEWGAELSRPSCWAYPDMLEVGRVAAPSADDATWYPWNRAHFGAWCVTSSPLVLGLELTDELLTPILDIIANEEAIGVNQAWAGHPGTLLETITAPPIPYDPQGATLPSSSPGDFDATDGATIGPGPKDEASSGVGNIRSGGPGQTSLVAVSSAFLGNGHALDAVHLSFRYSAGYTPAPGVTKQAATVRVLVLDAATAKPVASLYESAPLGNYSCALPARPAPPSHGRRTAHRLQPLPADRRSEVRCRYDHFTGYSPPIVVSATGLGLSNDVPLLVALEVANNERNLQIPIDDLAKGFDVKIKWQATAYGGAVRAQRRAADALGSSGRAAQASAEEAPRAPFARPVTASSAGVGVGTGLGVGQVWAKPQPNGAAAALVINHSPRPFNYTLRLAALNLSRPQPSSPCAVRDLWAHADLPSAIDAVNVSVRPYDSVFLLVAP